MVDGLARVTAVEAELEDELLEAPAQPPPLPAERILGGLELDGTTFPSFVDYRGVTFTGDVILRNVRFLGGFSFAGAVFRRRVRFDNVMNERGRGSKAEFDGAKFHGSAFFNRKSALYLASFQDTLFADVAKFQGCRFYASVDFARAVFASAANFRSAVFNGAGDFSDTRFESTADFEGALFRYPKSHAGFAKARFNGPAHFNDASLCGNSDFTEAVFAQGVTFHNARFALNQKTNDVDDEGEQRPAVLHDADVFVRFDRSTFHADEDGEVVNFEHARFGDHNLRREVSFDGAKFRPSMGPSKEQPLAILRKVQFFGPVSFSEAVFLEPVSADFDQARFEDKLDLSDCTFGSGAKFAKAQFRNDVILSQTTFQEYPDFRQATLAHAPEVSDAHLPSKLLGHKEDLVARIGALRRLASRTDNKRAEFDLLVRELKAEGGLASRLYGVVCNYGQSWARPALWLGAFTLVLFPLLHLAANNRVPSSWAANQGQQYAAGLTCSDGGNPFAAALELSVKNALIVAPENELQSRRISDCLGAPATSGARSLMTLGLQAAQIVLTLVMIFFIGGAIRRRLQIR